MANAIFGPLSREEFKSLVDAPYGKAAKAIRKHGPLFGLKDDEEITWNVCASMRARMRGYGQVVAASEDEAKKKADKLTDNDFDWDYDYSGGDVDIESVEPDR